jgi:hypothetical protein
VIEQTPDRPRASHPDLSRREVIQGALAVGGLGTVLHWNRPLVTQVMGGVHGPNTCLCNGSAPPTPPLGSHGTCVNHTQYVTKGKPGSCQGSMCPQPGCSCHNESKWTCVQGAWRRDSLKAVGCS